MNLILSGMNGNMLHTKPHYIWTVRKMCNISIYKPRRATAAEIQKVADAADISVLFFSAGANFWAILGHFWAILTILGHFWVILGHFWAIFWC